MYIYIFCNNYIIKNSRVLRTESFWYLKDDLKYYIDGRLYVKAEGVKWLNEKYYRKSYLKYLEYKKQNLDGYDI